MLAVREFLSPDLVVTSSGSSSRVGELCRNRGFKKCLIVTDENMVRLGLVDQVEKSLTQNTVQSCAYSGVETEPTVDYVQDGLQAYQQNGCDFVLAVGGGSSIDTAKAIAVMATNPGAIQDYKGAGKISNPGVPLVAIPTTAGTGSEVTIFTIITDTATDIKMLIISPYLMPDIAIVDPLLTRSAPPSVTAATGIDALVHAVEAYVSVKAQPTSDIFALAAIELISNYLRQAWANGNNLEAREKVMLGSLYAGHAFCNSSVALVHGMSRPIGANFHITHGVSNAVLFATVTEFSIVGNPARYARIAEAMGQDVGGRTQMEAAQLAAQAIRQLVLDIELPSLADLIQDEDKFSRLVPKMAEDAIDSGSPANNPRQSTKEQIMELYRRAYSI